MKSGRIVINLSFDLNLKCLVIDRICEITFFCVNKTPFGLPVEPEV